MIRRKGEKRTKVQMVKCINKSKTKEIKTEGIISNPRKFTELYSI